MRLFTKTSGGKTRTSCRGLQVSGFSCWGTGIWGNIHQKDCGVEESRVSDEQIATASVFRTCENRFAFKGPITDSTGKSAATDMASAGEA